ncbi:hypothetical protein ACNJYD_21335 [Bradyrhizobium sp. DASA03005]|uniref:hypothetical protein n=1 Tax=Bradyrhizobium sp. SPXBL-02 TaxID=3395912 RepID=UPI003F6FDC1D
MSGNKAYSEPFLANCCFPSILEELLMQVNRQSSKELPLHWSLDLERAVAFDRLAAVENDAVLKADLAADLGRQARHTDSLLRYGRKEWVYPHLANPRHAAHEADIRCQ